MAGRTTQDETVFVLNFSLDDSPAKGCVLFGWRDRRSPISRRTKASAGHAEGSKPLACTEGLQSFAGDCLKRLAEQNKSRVGVLGTASRRSFERQTEAGVQQLPPIRRAREESGVAGQARSMRQQHA